jgi:hypothetical protein
MVAALPGTIALYERLRFFAKAWSKRGGGPLVGVPPAQRARTGRGRPLADPTALRCGAIRGARPGKALISGPRTSRPTWRHQACAASTAGAPRASLLPLPLLPLMLGSSKPIPFDPYRSRRSRRGLPRWLVLVLLGIGLGAAAVLYVQERHLPPRLSADASTRLRESFERADAERQRLQAELTATADRLHGTLDENKRLASEVGARGEAVQRLREDVASLVATLPPDPRNPPVAVRAARFEVQGDTLTYNVVLSRERAGKNPFGGVMQLIVAGASGRATVALAPVPISVGLYDTVRGTLPLPQGLKPRQTTIQILDKVGGKLMGMRVMNVG